MRMKVIIVSMLFLMLVGCRASSQDKEPTLVDRSFVTGQPCAPPCWYGLELDKSTEKDVHAKLQELPFVDQGTITTGVGSIYGFSSATIINFRCSEMKVEERELCGVLILSGGYLKEIIPPLQYHLQLEEAVDRLGVPDHVIYNPLPHTEGCMLDLEWAAKRIMVRVEQPHDWKLCKDMGEGKPVDPDMKVTTLYYTAEEIFLFRLCKAPNCVPWPGFREK